eukprot:scaffold125872_cov22-Tisochrysis_lutea.AAC.2
MLAWVEALVPAPCTFVCVDAHVHWGIDRHAGVPGDSVVRNIHGRAAGAQKHMLLQIPGHYWQ